MKKQDHSRKKVSREEAAAQASSAQENANMIAVILTKAESGSVAHAKLLADLADYVPDGVYSAVKTSELEAVLSAMTDKAAAGHKGAARLLPKLQKALDYVKDRVVPIRRG
jgi:type II secretory pathway component PulF